MALEVLIPISYGEVGRRYKLEPDVVVADDFFDKKSKEALLKNKAIRKSKKKPQKNLVSINAPPLPDLSEMTVIGAKEFLENEYNVGNLERYLDQENSQDSPRESLTKWIDTRISELTGFEPARVR